MKIISCHNYYQQPGGEDQVFSNEAALLRQNGVEVIEYTRTNDELKKTSLVSTMANLYWNKQVYHQLSKLIRSQKPDIVHVHNFFPLISPAVFYAARDCGVPAVAGLNNQRFMCPGSTFTRGQKTCVDCLGKFFALPGVLKRCYRHSLIYSLGVASMFTAHRILGTWEKVIDGYIASTELYKKLFIKHGLPAAKIYVKPHMVQDLGYAPGEGKYALFIGRLDPEKGVFFLLRVWSLLRKLGHVCPLFIRGSGQCEFKMQAMIKRKKIEGVTFLPLQTREQLSGLVRQARFVLAPSRGLYETFCLVVVEAFANGIAVIAPRSGVFEEIVADGKTGILFDPDSVDACAKAVAWAWEHPQELKEMGRRARQVYEQRYLPQNNFHLLQDIYQAVIGNYQGKRSQG